MEEGKPKTACGKECADDQRDLTFCVECALWDGKDSNGGYVRLFDTLFFYGSTEEEEPQPVTFKDDPRTKIKLGG